ncbi:MAG: hypothetical protein ACE5O2_06370, partial [Armatimonadota bacterium]
PPAVEGIEIGKTADLLFFLQTARVTRPIRDDERARIAAPRRAFLLPEVARYVIHYADGETAEVPVVLEKHVDNWVQEKPKALEGALVAWTGAVPGLEGKKAVLYSMQVRNPRPDVVIDTIDFTLGKRPDGKTAGDRAIPVLLAITLGTLIE